MSKFMPFGGSERGYAAIDKFEKLQSVDNRMSKEVIAWFYSVLTILDAKANSLLRVNSLFTTIVALIWGAGRTDDNPLNLSHDQMATAVLAFFLVMVSTIFCFLIVRVNWRFLGKVEKNATTGYDFQREARRLANVVEDRTHYYVIGWWLTLVVVVLPFLLWLKVPPLMWLLHVMETFVPGPA